MLRGLYTGWTGMVNEQKRLDVISNNLANADTLGYKQESVSSQSFDKLLTIKIRDGSQSYHNQAIGTMSLGVKVGEVYTDYSQGSIRGTSSPLDLALSGSGFFTITTTNAKGETVTNYDYILKTGDNLYRVVDGATETTSNASVLQGYTEQSNVNVVSEMVDMITVTRAYEANQKMIRSQDSMLEKAVNQVGRLS